MCKNTFLNLRSSFLIFLYASVKNTVTVFLFYFCYVKTGVISVRSKVGDILLGALFGRRLRILGETV